MSPAASTVAGTAVFTTEIAGDCVTATSAASVSDTAAPAGGVPVTVAVFTTEPASTSACVTEYDAEQVVEPPGASIGTGQMTAVRPGNGSDTPTAVSVTLPVFVTTNEYATASPAAATVDGTAVFTTWIDGVRDAVTVAASVSVTGPPTGGVPLAVAVFTTEPASTSACVTEYDAEQVVEPPGASVGTGQMTAVRPGNGSDTPTAVSVTLPVFVTTNEYATVWPAAMTLFGTADFATLIDGDCVTVTTAVSLSVTGPPTGGVPDAVAEFEIEPASTSACVVAYDAVHVVDAPGANVPTGQVTAVNPGSGSATPTEVSVTLPVLVTTNEYASESPAAATVVGVADLATPIDGVCVTVTTAVSVSVTAAPPPGGVPAAVAVLLIEPTSTSACVVVYDAVHEVEALGAKVVTGHVTADRPGNASDTPTDDNVTLPVFVTTNE